jgi:hypothetical protein
MREERLSNSAHAALTLIIWKRLRKNVAAVTDKIS